MPSLAYAIRAKDAIDVVIAWVDGRDSKHRAKRKSYLADPGRGCQAQADGHRKRRFSDNDEIRFCLRSIRNYAPWIRTIWPVTDDQVPAAIDRRKAERDNIRIVDHREIFRGYEPTRSLRTLGARSGTAASPGWRTRLRVALDLVRQFHNRLQQNIPV